MSLKSFRKQSVKSKAFSTGVAGGTGVVPVINSVIVTDSSYNPLDDTALNPAGGYAKIIGENFEQTAIVYFNGIALTTTFVSSREMRIQTPVITAGSYNLMLFNLSTGQGAIFLNLAVSNFPTITTPSGVIQEQYESNQINAAIAATGDSALTYSIVPGSGDLPPGITLSSNGVLSGTAPVINSTNNYTFVVNVKDAQNQDSTRQFTLTIKMDVLTWNSPGYNNYTYSTYEYTPLSPVTLSVTSASGQPITYHSYNLPTGLSITGNTLSGTPTVAGTSSATINADCVASSKYTSRNINIQVNPDVVTWSAPASDQTFTAYEYTQFSPITLSSTSAAGFSTSYSASGLPSGITLSGNTISGSTSTVGTTAVTLTSTAATTNRSATRSINLQVNPDSVTWSAPNPGAVFTAYEYSAFTPVTLSASSAAGFSTSYSASGLPSGLTLTGNTISGTVNTVGTSSVTLTSTAATTNRSATRSVSFQVNPDVVTWNSPADATVYTNAANTPISNVTLSASSAAGFGVTYSANTLPTGVTLSNGVISGTPTVAGENISTTLTATAATTGRTATRQISWVINLAADSVWKNVSLLLSADTALQAKNFVTDSSTNNFQLTVTGDTKPNNNSPFLGNYYSNYFSGTGYITSPSSANMSLSSGDYTVEAWINLTGTQTTTYGWGVMGTYAGAGLGWSITINRSAGSQGIAWILGGAIVAGYTTAYIPTNTWTHVAITRSGTGTNNTKLFINGTLVTSVTDNTNDTFTGTNYIGGQGTGQLFTGYISNARVVKGTALYTASFVPSTTPLTAVANTQLLTCQSSSFKDNSTNNFTITRSSIVETKIATPHPFTLPSSNYGSGYFDGSGDYITTPGSSNLDMGTGDFTIECFALTNGYSGSQYGRGLFALYPSGNYNKRMIVRHSSGGYQLNIYGYDGSNIYFGSSGTTGSTALTPGVWNHIAFVRQSGVFRLYINGVQDIVVSNQTAITLATSNCFDIGRVQEGSVPDWNGNISNFRVIKGTCLYNDGTTFVPPTSELTAIANTQLLTLQTNVSHNSITFKDNSSFNNIFTRAASTNATNGTQSPYGDNWSVYLPGSTTSYYTIPASSVVDFGTGNFTVEFWFNIIPGATTNLSYNRAMMYGPSETNNIYNFGITLQGSSQGSAGILVYHTSNLITYNTAVSQGVWHHIALTRSGTSLMLFLDGVLVGSTNSSVNCTNVPITVGGLKATNATYDDYFSGYISNLRITKNQALYTGSTVGTTYFTPSTSPLTASSNTSLLTAQSNRVIDNSTKAVSITTNGTPTVQKFSPYNTVTVPKYYSTYFNGTSDYMTAPAASAAFGAGAWTIEMWFNLNSLSSASVLLDTRGTTSPNNGVQVSVLADGSVYWFEGSSTTVISLAAGTIITNRWYHLAFVRTGTGTNQCAIYLDGVLKNTGTSALNHAGNIPWIGRNAAAAQDYVKGAISNLRITKSAVYSAAFTPSTSPLTTTSQSVTASNVTLLTCQSSTIVDNSPNNYAITPATTTVKPLAISPFTPTPSDVVSYSPTTFGGSMYFDGTGDYISTPYSALYDINTGDFTVEAWVYRNVAGAEHNIFVTRSSSGSDGWNLRINAANTLQFYYTGGGTQTSTGTIPANTWTHVAACKSGTTLRLFINGVIDGVNTSIGTGTTNTAATLRIGVDNSSTTGYMNGYISDARIVKGQALYTANFYPPTSPITSASSVLVSGTDSGIIDASRTIDLESVGDVRVTSDSSPYTGKNSYFFDGTGDYIQSHTATGALYFGTGDFTIETWVKFTANNGTYNPFLRLDAGTLDFGYDFSSGQLKYNTNVGAIAASWTPTVGTWYHVALVRSGGYAKIYVNGTNVAAVNGVADSYNHNYASTTSLFRIGGSSYGASPPHVLKGYLSDLRVTRGNARTITVPTAPYMTK